MPWDGISPSVLRLTELIVQMAIFIYIAHLILSTVNVLHTEIRNITTRVGFTMLSGSNMSEMTAI